MRDRLEAAVLKWMDDCEEPMRWGHDDCALSFANIVLDALKYDPGAQWRGQYETREQAHKAVGAVGLGLAFKMLARKYGWKRINPFNGQVGDPGLALLPVSETESMVTTMICWKQGLWLARSESGYAALPMGHIRLAWSLG